MNEGSSLRLSVDCQPLADICKNVGMMSVNGSKITFAMNFPNVDWTFKEIKTPEGKSFALWIAKLVKLQSPAAEKQIIENADKIDCSIKSSRVLYESYDGSDWSSNFHHEEIRKGNKGLFIEVSQWIWDELWEKGCRSDFERFLDAGDADVDHYYDEYPLWLYLAEGWAYWDSESNFFTKLIKEYCCTEFEIGADSGARPKAQKKKKYPKAKTARELKNTPWMREYGKYLDSNACIDFDGTIFVESGVLDSTMERITELGGQLRKSISGKTNYLVVNPEAAGEGKISAVIAQRENGKDIKVILLRDMQDALDIAEETSVKTVVISPKPEKKEKPNKKDFEIMGTTLIEYKGKGREVVIPEGIETIAARAFMGKNIMSVVFPNSVKEVLPYAFHHCKKLDEVRLSEGLTQIPKNAFSECENLIEINIPKGVTEIGYQAFYQCSRIEKISLPEGLTHIHNLAFASLGWKFKDIILPESLTYIGGGAFFNCNYLAKIKLPEGVTAIGGSAFSCCNELTEVYIPNSVTEIGENCFGSSKSVVIHTPAGSYAEAYAKENGIPVVTV